MEKVSIEKERKINVNGNLCPLNIGTGNDAGPIGFIGRNNAPIIEHYVNNFEELRAVCVESHNIINSYSHIPAMFNLCLKLQDIINKTQIMTA